jgi:TolB-like protein
MTSWTRCSGSRALALLALLAAACGHVAARAPGPPPIGHAPGARPRVVLLPIHNMGGVAAPTDALLAAVAAALEDRFELVRGDVLERFLAKHRLRHTGGIDAEDAHAAQAELGADAILITSLQLYRSDPPLLGLAMRLVSTGDEPVILWMDSVVRSGDEAPGLLGLGLVSSMAVIEQRVLAEMTGSLADYLDAKPAADRCVPDRWRAPRVRFRATSLDDGERHTVAVVPFLNLTARTGAGDALAMEFVRQLVATGRYRVLEPGVVRGYLLRARVIMPAGVSLETTRMLLGGLGVELVLSGAVLDHDETLGNQSARVRFGATLLDGGSGDVVWNSSSFSRGDDGVFFFGLGRIRNSQELSCRMVAGVVDRMGRPGGIDLKSSAGRQRDIDPRRYTREARDARARSASGSGAGTGR